MSEPHRISQGATNTSGARLWAIIDFDIPASLIDEETGVPKGDSPASDPLSRLKRLTGSSDVRR